MKKTTIKRMLCVLLALCMLLPITSEFTNTVLAEKALDQSGGGSSSCNNNSAGPQKPENTESQRQSPEKDAMESPAPSAALENKTDSLPPLENKKLPKEKEANPLQSGTENAYINLTPVNEGTYTAPDAGVISVNYRPTGDETGKYIDILGFTPSGLAISALPVADGNIVVKAEYLEKSGDRGMRVYLGDKVTAADSVAFQFSMAVGNEKQFMDTLSIDPADSWITGLEATEKLGSETAVGIKAKSHFKVSAANMESTIYTRQNIITDTSFPRSPDNLFGNSGMVLAVKAEGITDFTTGAWKTQETEYTVKRANATTRTDGGMDPNYKEEITDRYMKDVELKIPLPNGVKVTGLPAEQTSGVKVSYDSTANYLTLTCDTLDGTGGNEVPADLKFRMTLDFTGVGANSQQLGIGKWHNFYDNNVDPSLTSRNETGRPWHIKGVIYGQHIDQSFYDRSALVPDSIPCTPIIGKDKARPFSFKPNEYKTYTELTGSNMALEPIRSYQSAIPYDRNGPTNPGLADTMVYTIAPEDAAARVIGVKGEFPQDIAVTFTWSDGTSETKGVSDMVDQVIKPKPYTDNTYITKVELYSPSAAGFQHNLVVDLQTKHLDGTPLANGEKFYIGFDHAFGGYGKSSWYGEMPSQKNFMYQALQPGNPLCSLVYSGGSFVSYYPPETPNTMISGVGFMPETVYTNVGFIKVSNTQKKPGSGQTFQDLKDVSYNAKTTSDGNWFYKLINKSTFTITLSGGDYLTALPTVTVLCKKQDNEVVTRTVSPDQFAVANGKATATVDFGLGDDEYALSYEMNLSSMPKMAVAELSINELSTQNRVLPDGTEFQNIDTGTENQYTRVMFSTLLRFSSLAGTTKNQYSNGNTFLYPKVGLMFDAIGLPEYDSKGKITVAPPQLDASGQSLLQGATQTLQLSLKDLAYNPTYAIEINKNFNYVPGSYKNAQIGGKNYKVIEEWLPNYEKFKGTPKEGNGLLRLRFVGSGSTGYNIDPVTRGNLSVNAPLEKWEFKVQAKMTAEIGIAEVVPAIYRSDKWAEKNLVGEKLAVKDWEGIINEKGYLQLPQTKGMTPVELLPKYANPASRSADSYDIDGDGDTTSSVYQSAAPANGTLEITKASKTRVDGYLVDPVSGLESRDANLYPCQTAGFVQIMEILDQNPIGGTDFIGYYHIPKKNHHIEYVDEEGTRKEFVSQFDTSLGDFITATLDGVPIPEEQMQIAYYLSANPEDVEGDDHNKMSLLEDGGVETQQEKASYKTKAEIEALVAGGTYPSLEDALSHVTMVKIQAPQVQSSKTVLMSTHLKIGHRPPDQHNVQNLVDYFSGIYRYTDSSATRSPRLYTPLMNFNMIPYTVAGSIWNDKKADSVKDPFEPGIAGIEVELWDDGVDPQGEQPPAQPQCVASATTGADGSYSMLTGYHGNYKLKFKIPSKQKLTLAGKGDLPYESSVFKETIPGNAETDYFLLDDRSLQDENGGLVDARSLEAPADFYLSVNSTLAIPYQITPDYLMSEEDYKIKPTITSEDGGIHFTLNPENGTLTGIAEGDGTVTLTIPHPPNPGEVLTKTVQVHVQPASVANVSVPTNVEIFAVQGKTNEIIAPDLTISNYNPFAVDAYIEKMDTTNTGTTKRLSLVRQKAAGSYGANEISLTVKASQRAGNAFKGMTETDIASIDGSALVYLGKMDSAIAPENQNWGQFTFGGAYNANILQTDIQENRFAMHFRFVEAKP
ncbi:SdrD B-like domain-containing protein [Eubacterium callanderi]|uniref:SdrD B-like domain-containing protein n=1 Tax=Eubacterium callanderi TaxID=53442 RepID=UPI0022E22CD7|nr:SdrD B-like domain-containing protein [Eubacterium callanderi]